MPQRRTLRAAFFENLVIASRLKNRHIVFLLVGLDFTGYAHPFGQFLDKVIIAFVNLLTQFAEVFGALRLLADNEQVENVVQYIRRNLLGGIAPRAVRVAVAFHNQTIKAQVHSLLAKRGNQLAFSADMTGVADDGQVRNAATQFDGNMPLRQVAV